MYISSISTTSHLVAERRARFESAAGRVRLIRRARRTPDFEQECTPALILGPAAPVLDLRRCTPEVTVVQSAEPTRVRTVA